MVINELRQITIASTAKGLVTFQQNDSPLNDLPEQIAYQGKLQKWIIRKKLPLIAIIFFCTIRKTLNPELLI